MRLKDKKKQIFFIWTGAVLSAAVLLVLSVIGAGLGPFRAFSGQGPGSADKEAAEGENPGARGLNTGAGADGSAADDSNASLLEEKDQEIGEKTPDDLITETVYKPIKRADIFEGIVPDRFGDAGLLLIPQVGINVRLFKGSESSSAYNQKGVDFEDSAGLINWGGEDVIGDHWNQGFTAIGGCVPQETKAYIVQEDHSYLEYICVDVMEGTNDDYHLTGNDEHDYMNEPSERCDLVMYTCLEDWQHIRLVLWKEVD